MTSGSVADEIKLTPMMEQYRSVKKTLSEDTVLFFRLGDFYEMFFEDAVRASEILNITLTGREGGAAGRVPMCGIPYHAFQGYVRTLLDANLKVAVCEQIGDPKAAKGLVERRITRMISPATYLDDDEKESGAEYLAALALANGRCALAYLELGTGEFSVREFPDSRLKDELSLLGPREIILPQSASGQACGGLQAFAKENLGASVTVYEDWVFECGEGMRQLREVFGLASEKGIPFHELPAAVSATGAVLYYLKAHLHASLGHVRLPRLIRSGDFLMMDRQTQKSLELAEGMSGKKGAGTLLATLDQSLTSMGARTLYQWLTQPLLDIAAIRARQEGVAEFFGAPSAAASLRSAIKGIRDIERTLSRLNCGVACARDLVNLRIFLERVPQFQGLLSGLRAPLLKEQQAFFIPFPNLRELIERAVVEVPPPGVRDGGMIRDGFSPELDELRGIAAKGRSWIAEFQQRESERTGIRSLRVKYSQVFGYTLEVSNANLHLVPPEYIRKQTLANAERFIVPELKSWDEKISGAQDRIKLLEYELFSKVREQVLEELVPLQAMARAVGVLDALASLAVTALAKKWVPPSVVETGELMIEGGRHPVVEAMLPAGNFVENDTFLDGAENQLIVLTGPNMAGKSTYIRQVALMTVLAQMGSYVPARSARIGLVDRIFTRIGASDDLARGESTFMVEMVETANILRSATKRSLLILDEVGRGTSTFDGVSIAWAICEHLACGTVRPRTLFATHYHELTQLEDHFPGIKNYNITVKEAGDKIVFLRRVVRGGSDRSYGIHVAELAGIPKAVTGRARQILGILESENTEATEIIEGKKENKREPKKNLQPTLFDLAAPNHPVLEELRHLSLDGMTPLQAMNKIAEWKEKLTPR